MFKIDYGAVSNTVRYTHKNHHGTIRHQINIKLKAMIFSVIDYR